MGLGQPREGGMPKTSGAGSVIDVLIDMRGEHPAFSIDTAVLVTVVQSTQANRISQGVTSDGSSAPPLTKRHAGLKRFRGQKPVRDLHLTGEMMASRRAVKTDSGHALTFPPHQAEKAAQLEQQVSMLGLAPGDIAAADAALLQEVSRHG